MPKIRLLPENLSNQIAAGEIVERPASVVKELAENAVDAGATRIFIDAEDSGRRMIRVSDDGEGMGPEDALRAFERHATSKIASEADLAAIRTMGFRGEALPSIASVSRVRLLTAPPGAGAGTEIRLEGGTPGPPREAAAAAGTLVEVADLFFNTPVRKKFLKSPATELAHILRVGERLALAHPGIHVRLTHNGRTLQDWSPVRDTFERIRQVLGEPESPELFAFSADAGGMRLSGMISRPGRDRAGRDRQEFFLNRRPVRDPSLAHALSEAYATFLIRGRHPAAYLFLEMDPSGVDVNVHPAKREVRFRNKSEVYRFIKNALREALLKEGAGPAARTLSAVSLDDRAVDAGYRAGSARGRLPERGASPDRVREAVSAYRPLDRGPVYSDEGTDPARLMSESVRVLGQIRRTYIVAAVGDELHLVDQHAAHERILFERLMTEEREDRIVLQPLLIPEVAEFRPAEALKVREALPALAAAGVEVEPFGEGSFRIQALPALAGALDGRALLADLLEEVRFGGAPRAEEVVEGVLATLACHAAVKAGQSMSVEPMTRLLEDLYRLGTPSTCPHGRPIRVRFSGTDLEKLFQRR